MSVQNGSHFAFGPFRVEPGSGLLYRGKARSDLVGAPLRLLLILLESPASFVPREVLYRRLWPDIVVDYEHCLNSTVRQLRAALNDSARNPKFIESKAKFGYRILHAPRNPPRKTSAAASPLRPHIVLLPWHIQRKPSIAGLATASAMLPQLMEELVADLRSRLPEAAISTPRQPSAPIETNDAEQNPRITLRGFLEEEGSGWRVWFEATDEDDRRLLVQLDPATPENATGQRLLLPPLDPPLLSGVGRRLAGWLGNRLLIPWRDHAEAPAPSAPVREACLRGFYLWSQRSRPSLVTAMEEFRQAIRQDPDYALAHAGLAYCASMLGMYGIEEPRLAFTTAQQAAERALATHPANPGAILARATARTALSFDLHLSQQETRDALTINPELVEGWLALSRYQVASGRISSASVSLRQAERLDPASPVLHAVVAMAYFLCGRADEAVRHGQIAVSMAPHLPIAQAYLCLALSQNGQHAQASALAESFSAPNPDFPPALPIAGWALARAGGIAEARAILAQLRERRATTHFVPTLTAALAAALGNAEEALGWLETAVEQRCSWLMFLRVDPHFDSLRNLAAFQRLMAKVQSQ